MWQRIRTALVLLVIVGGSLFFPYYQPMVMLGLMLFIAFIAAWEWRNLLPGPHSAQASTATRPTTANAGRQHGWLVIALPLVSALLLLADSRIWIAVWALAVVYWIVTFFWVRRFPQQTGWFTTPVMLLSAFISIPATITAIYSLWQHSPYLLLAVFGIVWIADSGAYFVGRKLGRRKLIPAVSPNKTVEGLIGGLLLTALYLGLIGWHWLALPADALLLLIVVGMLTALFSVLGDLVESMHKRQAGIKDSGSILPGHGGVLDRIDSIMAALPVFALCLALAGRAGYSWLMIRS